VKESPSLIVAGGPSCEKLVSQKWPGAKVVSIVRDLSLLEYMISDLPVDAVVVEPTLSPKGETFDQWVTRFKAAFPGVSLVLTEGFSKNTGYEDRAECKEEPPLRPKVLTSQTIVVWSPKGGVGKTFLAANLACASSIATEGNTALIDLDLYSGDVSVYLDLMEGPTITDILPVLSELRPDGLDKFALRHGPTGLNVILSPRRPELSDLITAEHVRTLLSLAEKRWGLVYVDTPPDITSDVVGECVEIASRIVLVVTQDAASLRQCKIAMEILWKLGVKRDVVAVVLNRVSKDSLMPQGKVEEFLGVELSGVIPDDRKAVERSIFEGRPVILHSKSEMAEAVWQAMPTICPGLECPRKEKKPIRSRRGFFW